MARDADLAAKTGDVMRPDLQNMREIIGQGPGWVTRLEEALQSGKIALPAVLPFLAAAGMMPQQEQQPQGAF
jgi:hypothetical protein